MKKFITAAVFLCLFTTSIFSVEMKMFYPGVSREYAEAKLEDTCFETYKEKGRTIYGPCGSLQLKGNDITNIAITYLEYDNNIVSDVFYYVCKENNWKSIILDVITQEEITLEVNTPDQYKGRSKNGYYFAIEVRDSIFSIKITK